MSEEVPWLSSEEQALWRRLLEVECRLRDRLDHQLQAAHGLCLGDYAVLVHLSEAPGGALRMSELAERVHLSRSGLTRLVDGLVRRGFVDRSVFPGDARGLLAALTPAGAELLGAAAPTHVAGVRRCLLDAIGDVSGLAAGLSAISAALDGQGLSRSTRQAGPARL